METTTIATALLLKLGRIARNVAHYGIAIVTFVPIINIAGLIHKRWFHGTS
jgi:hypothetical protein